MHTPLGGRHSRGAKRFSGTLTRTTAAAFNSPSGALGPRARSANSCALRRVTTPGPVVGGTTSRPARMRGRWTDSSSSRARALLTAARALQQECRKPQCGIVRLPHRAAAAPLLLGHHRELGGPLRGRGQHRAGSLLRAGADRGCDSRLCRRVCGLAPARLRVQIPRRSRAPPPPARGGISVREFCVPVPVLHLLLPCQSLRTPLCSATS